MSVKEKRQLCRDNGMVYDSKTKDCRQSKKSSSENIKRQNYANAQSDAAWDRNMRQNYANAQSDAAWIRNKEKLD
jgi:hypothetical protein